MQHSNEVLPDIAPESDIHISCEKLPDLPDTLVTGTDNAVANAAFEKQKSAFTEETKDTAAVADEYPPLPDYPPGMTALSSRARTQRTSCIPLR